MSHKILPLFIKSARVQQKIAEATAKPQPNRLLILRLQTLRLTIQKRINAVAAAVTARQVMTLH